MEKTLNNVYDTTATIGRAKSITNVVIGTIIGIVMIVIGIYLITKTQNNLVDSTAIVSTSTCTLVTNNKSTTHNCTLGIKYNVNNQQYSGNISTNDSQPHAENSTVDITYDNTNPNLVTARQMRYRTIGFVLCGVSVLIISSAWLNYYLSNTYKGYAAYQGAETVIHGF